MTPSSAWSRRLTPPRSDLGKSATETYMCETGMTLSELSYMRRSLAASPKTAMC
ncbi:MAG: hypothetical protein V8Q79_02950 [Christensenellales bacterium]